MNIPFGDHLWPLVNRGSALHVSMYRRSGGRIGGRIFFFAKAKIALVEHVGGKSGVHRTMPLIYIPDGDNVVIVASKGGFPQHPAWFHNLRANPDTWVQVGPERRPVHARVATEEERARLWPRAVSDYKSFADYQRRTPRVIPMVILEPRAA